MFIFKNLGGKGAWLLKFQIGKDAIIKRLLRKKLWPRHKAKIVTMLLNNGASRKLQGCRSSAFPAAPQDRKGLISESSVEVPFIKRTEPQWDLQNFHHVFKKICQLGLKRPRQYKTKSPKFSWQEVGWENHSAANTCTLYWNRKDESEDQDPESRAKSNGEFFQDFGIWSMNFGTWSKNVQHFPGWISELLWTRPALLCLPPIFSLFEQECL